MVSFLSFVILAQSSRSFKTSYFLSPSERYGLVSSSASCGLWNVTSKSAVYPSPALLIVTFVISPLVTTAVS